jgi:tetratricopeptide (TPR) repeat protein
VHSYGVREVERLLRLPRSTIRALIAAGFVSPARGPRRAWRFSFQDLIVLRTASALIAARVPRRRITGAIRDLRRRAASGQYPLAFGAAPAAGRPKASARSLPPQDWLGRGFALHQAGRLAEAERAYREGLQVSGDDPALLYNLGVLLEDLKRKGEAVKAYETALRGDPRMADGHYNLALLYEELARPRDAIRHMATYRRLTRGR